jgi:hypothetical protein
MLIDLVVSLKIKYLKLILLYLQHGSFDRAFRPASSRRCYREGRNPSRELEDVGKIVPVLN